jgi:3'(2'), 5'-bisphosphate nucleotidase
MNELDVVLSIARRAAALVMDVYASDFAVDFKGPNDPVTRADREANDLICTALEKAFPGDAIVAEEAAPEGVEATRALVSQERVWFVDPLDGTREFADRTGEFAVMIGLAINARAALGVVVMPTTGVAIAGLSTGGSFLEEASGARRPIAASSVSDPKRATMIVSRSHPSPLTTAVGERLGVARVVRCGSVGVKVARVVTSEADLYVHAGAGSKRWDTCGPEAVLRGAGGKFGDVMGAPIDYADTDLVLRRGMLAANAELFDAAASAARALHATEATTEKTS